MRKSKIVVSTLSLLLAGAIIFSGCKNQADPVEPEQEEKTEVVTYKVTFDSDGGSGLDPVTVEEGAVLTKPEDPAKEGYTFVSWNYGEAEYDFTAPVTEDLSLKAIWKIITCKVTFETNGGSTVDEMTVNYGDKITVPETAPTKENAYFSGWFTNAECTEQYTDAAVKADITLYAKWSTEKPYVITLNYNYEGSKDSSVNATSEAGYKITAPKADRDDYELTGWYSDKECKTAVDFDAAFTGDTTIYAGWKRVYSLKDETSDKYNVYLVTEGTSAAETKTYTNGAVAAFFTTKNNGDEIVLNVNSDGSAASSTKYDKVTIKFDYEVAEWSDSTVTPKFKLSSDAFDSSYFEGKVEGGSIEKTVNLKADITTLKLAFNAFEWAGAETDRIKVVVRSVTLSEIKAFDLGDETEGSYTLYLDSTTATQKKTYTNGAVAALLETTSNGDELTFKIKEDGSSVKSNDYSNLKVTFDYEKINWAEADSEVTAKFKITCDGIDGYNSKHTEYFENSATTGTVVKTIPLISDVTFSTVKLGFNAFSWTGSSTDSIKVIVRKIELIEKEEQIIGDAVSLTKENCWDNGASYSEKYTENGVSYVGQYEYGGGGYAFYIDSGKEDVDLSSKYSSVVIDFSYNSSWTASKTYPVKFALKCWKKGGSFYEGATALGYANYNESSDTVRWTVDIPENAEYNTIALCSGYIEDSNADGDKSTTDTVTISLTGITFVAK